MKIGFSFITSAVFHYWCVATQLAFTCSKLTIETLGQGVKYVEKYYKINNRITFYISTGKAPRYFINFSLFSFIPVVKRGSTFAMLTLSWRRPLSYRNLSIDLLCNGPRHERVKIEI